MMYARIIDGWCVRKGFGSFFEAEVVAIRPRYPRVHVRYVKDLASGETVALALPQPREAYLHAGAIEPLC